MHTARPSLRSDFAWTLTGNAVHGLSQWAILSVLAKLGSADIVGRYALATALAMPPMMLAHLNLRTVLATDVAHRHPFGDYLLVRFAASAAGVLAILVLARDSVAAVIALALAFEAGSDLYYGAMQRDGRMDRIARSMIVRALISITAVAAAVGWRGNALAAALALAGARAVVLLSYDLPRSRARWDGTSNPRQVLAAALPLGFVLMLIALTANIPRYAIEANLGTREVGVFAAVASFATTGSAIVNALGQSAVTRLARLFESGDRAGFRSLAVKVVVLAGALGLMGVVVAAAGGPWFLRWIYRPEYSVYAPLLVAVLIAAAPAYAAQMAGYVTTSTRAFGPQMPLLSLVAAVCAAVSFAAVPAFGLYGAALALGTAAVVQLAGQLWILKERVQWRS